MATSRPGQPGALHCNDAQQQQPASCATSTYTILKHQSITRARVKRGKLGAGWPMRLQTYDRLSWRPAEPPCLLSAFAALAAAAHVRLLPDAHSRDTNLCDSSTCSCLSGEQANAAPVGLKSLLLLTTALVLRRLSPVCLTFDKNELCPEQVLIWNQLARGNAEFCAVLVAVNSVLQVILYSPLAVFYLKVRRRRRHAAHCTRIDSFASSHVLGAAGGGQSAERAAAVCRTAACGALQDSTPAQCAQGRGWCSSAGMRSYRRLCAARGVAPRQFRV